MSVDLEPLAPFTTEEARAHTERIVATLHVAHDLIVEAYARRAWVALGDASWDYYCATRLAGSRMVRLEREQRREIVTELRAAEMPVRAIASGLGVSVGTVHADATASVQNRTDARPAMVTSLDGRRRPASRTPAAVSTPSPPPERPAPGRRPTRRPLPDTAVELSRDLDRMAGRVRRMADDDRLGRNREVVAGQLWHTISEMVSACADLQWDLNPAPSVATAFAEAVNSHDTSSPAAHTETTTRTFLDRWQSLFDVMVSGVSKTMAVLVKADARGLIESEQWDRYVNLHAAMGRHIEAGRSQPPAAVPPLALGQPSPDGGGHG